jgi:hypothetical protein
VSEWTDEELEDYCRRFNIGWVVCRSKPTLERFLRWSKAERIATFGPNGEGVLLALNRPRSYVLLGQARWLGAEVSRVRLADVVPENGVIILSLHYQKGLIASPDRVKVEEPGPDPRQDIPLVRLRVDAPVAHLTLVWEK